MTQRYSIVTKFVPSTNTKGARIRATLWSPIDGKKYHAYTPYSGGFGTMDDEHAAALLAEKVGCDLTGDVLVLDDDTNIFPVTFKPRNV